MLHKRLAWAATCLAVAAQLGGCRDPGPGTAPPAVTPNASGGPGTATLSWEAPASNTNGTQLTNLAGYRIYYGSSPEHLTHTVHIKNVGLQICVIDDLEPGLWYFAVKALTADGAESALSEVVAKTII